MNIDTGNFRGSLSELEARISLDLAARAVSWRLRRLIALGVAGVAVLLVLAVWLGAQASSDRARIARIETSNSRILTDADLRIRDDGSRIRALQREVAGLKTEEHHDSSVRVRVSWGGVSP